MKKWSLHLLYRLKKVCSIPLHSLFIFSFNWLNSIFRKASNKGSPDARQTKLIHLQNTEQNGVWQSYRYAIHQIGNDRRTILIVVGTIKPIVSIWSRKSNHTSSTHHPQQTNSSDVCGFVFIWEHTSEECTSNACEWGCEVLTSIAEFFAFTLCD